MPESPYDAAPTMERLERALLLFAYLIERDGEPPGWEALHSGSLEKTGAGEGARTLDPDLGKVVITRCQSTLDCAETFSIKGLRRAGSTAARVHQMATKIEGRT